MKTTFNALMTRLALIVAVVLLLAPPTWAQSTINNTTLSAAMTAVQNFVTIGSVTCTGCTVGRDTIIYVDSEALCVNASYTSGTTLPVTRGCLGTKATAHAINLPTTIALNVVFIGPPKRFQDGAFGTGDPPAGACVRAQIAFLPWINMKTGALWTCDGYNWRALYNWNINGTSATRPTAY
jgi:hypothetical protein